MQSTAEDLYKFVEFLHGNSLVQQSVKASLADEDGLHLTGATNGFFSFVDKFDKPDIVIIFTGNSWGGCAGQLRARLPAMIQGDEVDPPVFPVLLPGSVDPNEWSEHCGEYESRPGATTTVEIRNARLTVGGGVVLPIARDRYFHQAWHVPIEFVRDNDQVVVSLSIGFESESQVQPKLRGAAKTPVP